MHLPAAYSRAGDADLSRTTGVRGYRLLRALRPRLSRFLNHGWTQMNTDKRAMWEVGHGFATDTRRGPRSVSIRVDPWFVQVLDMRCQAQY